MKIKSAIFDMDGTLLDTLNVICFCNNEIFRKHGFPERELHEYRNFVGDGMRNLLRRALPEGTSENTITDLMPEVLDIYHGKGVSSILPYDGITEMLNMLVEKEVKISILTNKEHKYAVMNAEKLLGNYYFEAVLGEREGFPVKPDPSGIFEIASITGIPLSETIYAGDMVVDILTGKNAGVFTVGCLWGFGNPNDLEKQNADMLIKHPLDILKLLS